MYYFVSWYPLDLSDTKLHPLVESPVKIEIGGRGILKVNRSEKGAIMWFHNGRIIDAGRYSHFTFLDTQRSTGTELEISNATADYEGSYEVVLMTDRCFFRNLITVKVQGKCDHKITS